MKMKSLYAYEKQMIRGNTCSWTIWL